MAAPAIRQNTADVILDACDSLMARYGFRRMTMDDVAQQAGVSKRTIYGYFSSKEELGLKSIGRVVSEVHAELEEIVGSKASLKSRLHDVLAQRVMGRVERVSHYSNSLDELFEVVRPAYMAKRAEYFAAEKALAADLLAQGIAAGEFDFINPEDTAEAMILATNAFLPYSLSVQELGTPESIAAKLETLIGVLLHGVCTTNKSS